MYGLLLEFASARTYNFMTTQGPIPSIDRFQSMIYNKTSAKICKLAFYNIKKKKCYSVCVNFRKLIKSDIFNFCF